MDVEEVHACRDLGLELPFDCTVEIQRYGLTSSGSSPTHTTTSSTDSSGVISNPGGGVLKALLEVEAKSISLIFLTAPLRSTSKLAIAARKSSSSRFFLPSSSIWRISSRSCSNVRLTTFFAVILERSSSPAIATDESFFFFPNGVAKMC
uniref:Uncharacterized protein n=1 Tax=Setaria viridis TaxID=4556 RepID=A0A4V6DB67_SETVI|nr:hypothetical protein SEVIR_2G165200v2 [Setaria viridis]